MGSEVGEEVAWLGGAGESLELGGAPFVSWFVRERIEEIGDASSIVDFGLNVGEIRRGFDGNGGGFGLWLGRRLDQFPRSGLVGLVTGISPLVSLHVKGNPSFKRNLRITDASHAPGRSLAWVTTLRPLRNKVYVCKSLPSQKSLRCRTGGSVHVIDVALAQLRKAAYSEAQKNFAPIRVLPQGGPSDVKSACPEEKSVGDDKVVANSGKTAQFVDLVTNSMPPQSVLELTEENVSTGGCITSNKATGSTKKNRERCSGPKPLAAKRLYSDDQETEGQSDARLRVSELDGVQRSLGVSILG